MPAGSALLWNLTLLRTWQLRRLGKAVKVAPRQQSLIAVMALYGDRSRLFLANLLWGDSNESQAMGNLRASVWQIRRQLPGLLSDHDGKLGLTGDVHVDVDELYRGVDRISARTDERELWAILDSLAHAVLLPTWHDDWVSAQRERLQQVRVAAFESLAQQFIARDMLRPALVAAQRAVHADPLRETAHRLLAESHIANGDPETAVRVYRHFRSVCLREFGLEPSERFARLIEGAKTRLHVADRTP